LLDRFGVLWYNHNIVVKGEKMLPDVTVLVVTYDRPAEIRTTILALEERLHYTGRLLFNIADDGTSLPYLADLRRDLSYLCPTFSRTNRQGWGANVNEAQLHVKTPYTFLIEDDYVLLRDLNLTACVALMEMEQRIGMLRFGIVGHGFACRCRETDISGLVPDYQENDTNRGYTGAGKINWWEVVLEQPRGPFTMYRYSNRPHLKRCSFHEFYGRYPEGFSLGETEHAMNHRILERARRSPDAAPLIGCPADFTLWHFDHIGKSRQGTGEDVHARGS